MSPLLLPLLALPCALLLMVWIWRVAQRTGNAGWVDAAWTGLLGALALAYALTTPGVAWRRALVAALVLAWMARLLLHLVPRVARGPEDGRYRELRRTWGAAAPRRLLQFFLAQGVLAILLSYAYLVPMTTPDTALRLLDVAALGCWLVGVGGEAVADRQLARWIADPAHRGRTCRHGLWRLSRHPNYFFEWLHWFAFPLLATGAPGGPWVWLAPALMGLLLVYVTGIPPSEAQALRSRGEDYRRYQRATNAFFPWAPRPEER